MGLTGSSIPKKSTDDPQGLNGIFFFIIILYLFLCFLYDYKIQSIIDFRKFHGNLISRVEDLLKFHGNLISRILAKTVNTAKFSFRENFFPRNIVFINTILIIQQTATARLGVVHFISHICFREIPYFFTFELISMTWHTIIEQFSL